MALTSCRTPSVYLPELPIQFDPGGGQVPLVFGHL